MNIKQISCTKAQPIVRLIYSRTALLVSLITTAVALVIDYCDDSSLIGYGDDSLATNICFQNSVLVLLI